MSAEYAVLLMVMLVSIGRFGYCIRGLSQITFALRVGRWSEKRVVYYIKSAN